MCSASILSDIMYDVLAVVTKSSFNTCSAQFVSDCHVCVVCSELKQLLLMLIKLSILHGQRMQNTHLDRNVAQSDELVFVLGYQVKNDGTGTTVNKISEQGH